MFKKFDIDQSGKSLLTSGTLEVNELAILFEKSNIKLPKKELLSLFQMFDTDHSGNISLQEFINILINDQANRKYREHAD